MPGKRLKLHPDDYYALGAHRGGIDERWFASTTEAGNDNRADDEGLSSVVSDGERFTLLEAVCRSRALSLAISSAVLCVPPSTSMMTRLDRHAKSTMKWSIGTCWRNLKPARFSSRSFHHSRRSADVRFLRSSRARLFGIVLVATPTPNPSPQGGGESVGASGGAGVRHDRQRRDHICPTSSGTL
jgi:hypothetical protein